MNRIFSKGIQKLSIAMRKHSFALHQLDKKLENYLDFQEGFFIEIVVL